MTTCGAVDQFATKLLSLAYRSFEAGSLQHCCNEKAGNPQVLPHFSSFSKNCKPLWFSLQLEASGKSIIEFLIDFVRKEDLTASLLQRSCVRE